jgi:ArsR family transcriptional regulator
MLAKKEARMCSHIVDELPLAQSTVSEHLRILRMAGLVRANENGPRVSYCIVPSALQRLAPDEMRSTSVRRVAGDFLASPA